MSTITDEEREELGVLTDLKTGLENFAAEISTALTMYEEDIEVAAAKALQIIQDIEPRLVELEQESF